MRIGVLSDTHASSLPPDVLEKLRGLNLDLIIHCGDYTDINVVHQLRALGNFCGVAGNMDPSAIRNLLKEKEIIEVEGKRIGVFHGYGLFLTDKKLEDKFKGEKIDLYIHGHTHRLRKEKKKDIYYLNPGPFPKSMLVINIEKDKEIEIEILSFK
jgi:putative phosphoesterase